MMAFVGDAPTTTSDAAKVMFTGFVNYANAVLVGDIGLGIYKSRGQTGKSNTIRTGRKEDIQQRAICLQRW